MSKTITRKYIQRITKREGNTNVRQSSGGGGGGGGGASQYWVEENYISKLFFNQLFTVYDEDGNIVEPNDTESVIDSIKSMFGFWTDAYLSALGNNPGGGGAELTLASLADVAVQGVADGQALVWNAALQKWVPGQGGGIDITAMWAALAQSGTQQIDVSHLGTALTGYATETWVGNQGYITSSALNGYATENWVGSQISDMATQTWVSGNYLSKTDAAATYVSIAFFERLFKAYNGSTVVHPNNTTSTIDNIKAMFGFWTEQYISALGKGSSGESGVDMATVWTALGNATTEQINASHLSTALSSYATQSWVISQIPTVVDAYTKTESDGRYYAIYGGTNLNPSSTNPVNIDTLIEHGNYYCSNSSNAQYVSTLPDGFGNRAFRLHVGSFWTGTRYIYQRIQGFSRTNVYERYSSASTTSWSDWHLVQDNLANYVTASELTSALSGYALTSQIPTNNNQLANGAGYITSSGSITGNAGSATKLLTARTIWGQNFDGTSNVSGDMSSVGNISFSASGKNIGGLMYFDTTNSNIGIGTSSPSYKLDVVGQARAKLLFFYNRANNANAGYIGAGSSSVDYIYFQAYTDNGLYIGANNGFDFVILPNHNVGVGTTEPSYKMHVSGTFHASGNSSIGGTLGVTGATTLSSSLSVTGNSTLTGYVGIGTAASSSYALKVSGVAYASTGVYSAGYVTALSDIRHKDVKGDVGLTVSDVANAPAVKFLWKDRRQEGLQVGSIAQYWQKVMPEAVVEGADGELTMSYGVIALIAAIKTARKVEDLERRVNLLEQENRLLKEQLKVA